jgi:hypothetical protein
MAEASFIFEIEGAKLRKIVTFLTIEIYLFASNPFNLINSQILNSGQK